MTTLLATRHGRGEALAAACAALLVAGCAAHSADHVPAQSSDRPASADALDSLKKAMPAKSDFPENWRVEAHDAPPLALPGLDDGSTVISVVVPDGCREFAAEFVSSPGSSIPGDFVASTIAMIPNDQGVFDQSSVVVFATKDAGAWGAPHALQESVRPCGNVTAQMSMQGRMLSVGFSSALIDTSAIKGEAAGRATIIHASEARVLMAVVRAKARGVLVSASSMIVSGSGDDQKALLVRLVAQTVDKLNAI
ncbi:MAG: hypothetical protein ACRC20_12715 [Segniliparus sp.]|uniref:hypothetical protein n=1 Tax=Segniliparus sp. TaxID=2804064 RepID=UPI003F2D0901